MAKSLQGPIDIKIRGRVLPLVEVGNDPDLTWEPHTYLDTKTKQRVLDPDVRNCFVLKDAWKSEFTREDKAVLRAQCGGGTGLEFHPQELLLYKSGCHFGEHTDRVRRIKGLSHIGTLVVGIAKGRGGGLEVEGAKVMLPLETPQSYFIPLDTRHSVLPLSKGWRCVVKYGVYRKRPENTTPKAPRIKKFNNGRKD